MPVHAHPHDMVREFHLATGLPARSTPTVPSGEEIALRIALLREECEEAIEALENLATADGDPTALLAHVAKELADVIYVAAGAEVTLGIPGPAVFDEVHRSNMSKLPRCQTCGGIGLVLIQDFDEEQVEAACQDCHGTGRGPALRRQDGKVLKPDTYSPADVEAVFQARAS